MPCKPLPVIPKQERPDYEDLIKQAIKRFGSVHNVLNDSERKEGLEIMETKPTSSNLQRRAAALWKWGKRYPNLWPNALEWAAEVYRQDRIERGVE